MSKPILYGYITSPPVRACLLTAAAIGLDIEFREVNVFKQEHLNSDFLKKNPQHTIPTLEVDGKYLCDSHAIVTFLVSKYGKNDFLYPKDLFERAIVDQRLYYDASVLFPRLRILNFIIIKKEITTFPKDVLAAVYEAYDFLETFLTGNDFVAGNNMTVADFCCIGTIKAGQCVVPLSSEKYPNILAWIERMESLAYFEENFGKGNKMLVELFETFINEFKNSAKN